jgi:hypothetical protein
MSPTVTAADSSDASAGVTPARTSRVGRNVVRPNNTKNVVNHVHHSIAVRRR